MVTNLLLPWLPGFHMGDITLTDQMIDLELTAVNLEAVCPCCSQPSCAIHSHYDRTITDLPWAHLSVRLRAHVRKFFCRNPACERKVFTERFPLLVAPSARRTQRLATEQRQLALDQGGEAAARTAGRQGMPVSPRTLLRLVRRTPEAAHPTPRILGVDDFAFRKGQSYGTLLVDLQQHQPIDMLADRSAASLAKWLEQHPGVEIITRDRAPEYVDGATRGAPNAIQVADRFHLLQNLREAAQRLLERHQAALRSASAPPSTTDAAASSDPSATAPPPVEAMTTVPAAHPPTRLERVRQERRQRRLARYSEVRALHTQGHGIRAIARQLDLSRQTVRRLVRADQFPEQASRPERASKLDEHIPYLEQQLLAGNDNARALWHELRDNYGYAGSRTLISTWVARHRHLCPTEPVVRATRPGRPPASDAPSPSPVRILSARQAAWLLVRRPDELEAEDGAIVERLCQSCPDIQVAYPLVQELMRIVRERHRDALESWVCRASGSGIAELLSFATGLRRDQAAVAAALTLPFSNGQVEGQVNRLKLIKRSGYGRAKFDLLRQRVLAA
jgi:transposase